MPVVKMEITLANNGTIRGLFVDSAVGHPNLPVSQVDLDCTGRNQHPKMLLYFAPKRFPVRQRRLLMRAIETL
jgi:hypothetical protein